MEGDPYRAPGESEGHSSRHRETTNYACQLGVELRWRQDQGKPALLRHAVLHAAARHIATVTAMCRHSPPNTAVELTGKKLALFTSQLTAGVGHNNETCREMDSLVDIEKKPWHVAVL